MPAKKTSMKTQEIRMRSLAANLPTSDIGDANAVLLNGDGARLLATLSYPQSRTEST